MEEVGGGECKRKRTGGCCLIQGRGRDGLEMANNTKLGEPPLKLKDLKIC